MQQSITSFFKKAPSSGINKPKKRSTALSPQAAKLFKEESLAPDVKARIAASRAAARAKLLARAVAKGNNKITFGGALEPSWRSTLGPTLKEPFWGALAQFVEKERREATVYPPPDKIFSAFNHSSFARTRVVILGQDPYHGPGQAHGMSFSVPDGVFAPPSLQNIFKELEKDITGFKRPKGGCLEKWANQGVLLLNSVLTVRRSQPNSHKNRGWERFTDAVVQSLNRREGPGLVFMLWGGYAKKKGSSINGGRHCVLKSVHPSPLSANQGGWFGSRHFSKANAFLEKTKQDTIDWKL